MGSTMYSTDAQNKLEDLSGIVLKPGENPYEAFIQACDNKPVSVHTSQIPCSIPIFPKKIRVVQRC